MIRNLIVAAGLAAALAMSAGAAQAQSADKASQKFIANAMEGDYVEIDVGKLAQEKGQSQAVKDFGASWWPTTATISTRPSRSRARSASRIPAAPASG